MAQISKTIKENQEKVIFFMCETNQIWQEKKGLFL